MAIKFFILTCALLEVQSQIWGPTIYPGPVPYEQYVPSCAPSVPQIPPQLITAPCPPQLIAAPCPPQPVISVPQNIFPNPTPSFIPPTLTPSLTINPAPCTYTPQVAPTLPAPGCNTCNSCNQPVVATIVDNTLANSLANAIQLLIVSNLIENTLGCGGLGSLAALNEPISPCIGTGSPCIGTSSPCLGNIIEVVAPDCFPVYAEPAYEVPCIQEQIVFQAPCETPYTPTFAQIVPAVECTNINNPFTAPSFSFDNAVGTLSPCAAEVLFPSAIPAQLTCNFGYMASNVPCVSVNVEPLPFDFNSCGFNNGFYY